MWNWPSRCSIVTGPWSHGLLRELATPRKNTTAPFTPLLGASISGALGFGQLRFLWKISPPTKLGRTSNSTTRGISPRQVTWPRMVAAEDASKEFGRARSWMVRVETAAGLASPHPTANESTTKPRQNFMLARICVCTGLRPCRYGSLLAMPGPIMDLFLHRMHRGFLYFARSWQDGD